MKIADLSIIYQDHYLLLVNKPADLVIHPTYKHTDGQTMWDFLLARLAQQGPDDWQPPLLPDEPEWAAAPADVRLMLRRKRDEYIMKKDGLLPKPCLVHRLDKDTSGIVALARTERSRRHLIKQFHDHTIDKRYLAVVELRSQDWAHPRALFTAQRIFQGQPSSAATATDLFASAPGMAFLLDGPLQRDPDDRCRCIVGPDGQSSSTSVSVLAVEPPFALVDVKPITGRTHQIRAHLAAWGCAIVGDQTYAPPAHSSEPASFLSRQFLHAYRLSFRRYPTNDLSSFTAGLADDLFFWLHSYCPELAKTYQSFIR